MKKIIFISLLGLFSCQPDNPQPNIITNNGNGSDTTTINDETTGLSIGSWYQGGVIFYLNENGGGLIVGNHQTNDDISMLNWYEAIQICEDLVQNGYSDWYLPSIEELNLIRQNLHLNGFHTSGFDTFAYGSYWSSKENGTYHAWHYYFPEGTASSLGSKGGNYYNVRAIRSF